MAKYYCPICSSSDVEVQREDRGFDTRSAIIGGLLTQSQVGFFGGGVLGSRMKGDILKCRCKECDWKWERDEY